MRHAIPESWRVTPYDWILFQDASLISDADTVRCAPVRRGGVIVHPIRHEATRLFGDLLPIFVLDIFQQTYR
ncbi:MAG: hypothetical protein LC104_22160 [Bacteroidales bacterium]|nr:hypothetical protein [Bacteroidales bacterium]